MSTFGVHTKFHFPFIVLALLLFASTGCVNTGKKKQASPEEINQATRFWQPYLLYTSSNRYSKLYVEIDAVEGAEPPAERVKALHAFLATYCDKPGGIEVVVDEVLSADHARDRDTNSLALEHMRGPPTRDHAYMYILYYDSKVTSGKKQNPMALMLPYPAAIIIDRRYNAFRTRSIKRSDTIFLLHEAAHLLGMTRNTEHGDGVHCTNDNCINNAKIYYSVRDTQLFRDAVKQRNMCNDCMRDLATYRKAQPSSNLAFAGPYLLRVEKDYQVLTLPGLIFVHAGPLELLDAEDVEKVRKESYADRNASGIRYYITGLKSDVERVLPLLENDPYEFIRTRYKKLVFPPGTMDPPPTPGREEDDSSTAP